MCMRVCSSECTRACEYDFDPNNRACCSKDALGERIGLRVKFRGFRELVEMDCMLSWRLFR